MTVKELAQKLLELPPEQQDLEVKYWNAKGDFHTDISCALKGYGIDRKLGNTGNYIIEIS